MAKRSEFELHTFTVEGSGTFPYDMLRYDHCWPHSEGYDSAALDGHQHRRRVVLATRNRFAPTVGRWESFTWKVVGEGDQRGTMAAVPVPDVPSPPLSPRERPAGPTDAEVIANLLNTVYLLEPGPHVFAKVNGAIVHLGTGNDHVSAEILATAHGITHGLTTRAVLKDDPEGREFFLVRP